MEIANQKLPIISTSLLKLNLTTSSTPRWMGHNLSGNRRPGDLLFFTYFYINSRSFCRIKDGFWNQVG